MGCIYEWADDSHLIMNLYIEPPWTLEEYDRSIDEAFDILREHGKPCATAVDVSQIGKMPPGNPLASLLRVERLMPENVFASAVVGAPYVVVGMMDILMRIRPHAHRIALFAKTMPEAYEKIHQRYVKLYPPERKQS